MKPIHQRIEVQNDLTTEGLPDGGIYKVFVESWHSLGVEVLRMQWQKGPLVDPVTGEQREPNGLFLATAVEACIERLRFYQSTKFSCRENAIALTHLETGLLWLNARAERRSAEGSLGTHLPDAKPPR